MEKGHGTGYGIYIAVFIALMVMTGITVGVSYINLGLWNVAVALIIASLKASLVALYFMHLKREGPLVWVFALFPVLFLVLIMAGTLSDTLFR
ncbi:MAG TPA: cytochrome C oxidase subunit IV family protein [Anaerolineales bacterium]